MSHCNSTRSSPDWHSDRNREWTADAPGSRHDSGLPHAPSHCTPRAPLPTRKPWRERPYRTGAGPPRARGDGVVHATTCLPSPDVVAQTRAAYGAARSRRCHRNVLRPFSVGALQRGIARALHRCRPRGECEWEGDNLRGSWVVPPAFAFSGLKQRRPRG